MSQGNAEEEPAETENPEEEVEKPKKIATPVEGSTPKKAITGKLVLCIVGACIGNSFLYGWQIAVTNQPSEFIKGNFLRVNYKRKGGENEDYIDLYNFAKRNDRDGCINRAKEIVEDKEILKKLEDACKKFTDPDSDETKVTKESLKEFLILDPQNLPDDDLITLLFSITTSIFVVGGLIGCFASSFVADKFGRKTGMLLISPIIIIAAGLATAKYIPELLIASRFIGGLHSGLCVSMNSLYLTEISPTAIRGAIGVLFQLFITIGILMTQIAGLPEILGSASLYSYVFTVMLLPAAVSDACLVMCPESPTYMLSNRDDEAAARKGLQFLRGTKDVDKEMESMIAEHKKAKEKAQIKSYTLCELLRAPELRLATGIACVLMVAQQWSGVNAIFAYSTVMYQQVGTPASQIPYMVVLTGVVNVAMTVIAVPLMEKGRRVLLIYPTVLCCLAFLLMTVMLFLMGGAEEENKKTFGIICVVCIMLFIIGFAVGLGPIPFLLIGEIFRQEPRAAAMSLALLFNWICNFLLQLAYPSMKEHMQESANIPFIVVLVAAIAFFALYVPETRGRSIEEIVAMLGGRSPDEHNGKKEQEENPPSSPKEDTDVESQSHDEKA